MRNLTHELKTINCVTSCYNNKYRARKKNMKMMSFINIFNYI